jgi:hypothetical protein
VRRYRQQGAPRPVRPTSSTRWSDRAAAPPAMHLKLSLSNLLEIPRGDLGRSFTPALCSFLL